MGHRHIHVVGVAGRQGLGHGDAAVPPARAADGHHQVPLALGLVQGQHVVEQGEEAPDTAGSSPVSAVSSGT